MRIGIALSGGGSRCIAQLGVLAALEEFGLHPAMISGSSGGAIVGALYASGMAPEAIRDLLKEVKFKSLLSLNLHRGSLYRFAGARALFRKYLNVERIEALQLPFVCTMVDFDTGAIHYARSGDLIDHVLASCSLVPIFAPYTIGAHTYIDGGFSDNLPTLPLRDSCDLVVAINVNPFFRRTKQGFFANLSRALFIMFNTNVTEGKRHADLVIECSQMGRFSIFETRHFDRFYEIGYQSAQRMRPQIERLLSASAGVASDRNRKNHA